MENITVHTVIRIDPDYAFKVAGILDTWFSFWENGTPPACECCTRPERTLDEAATLVLEAIVGGFFTPSQRWAGHDYGKKVGVEFYYGFGPVHGAIRYSRDIADQGPGW